MEETNLKISYLPLIREWEKYLEINCKADIEDFAYWIIEKNKESDSNVLNDEILNEYFNQKTSEHNYSYRSSEAAFILWRMSKFIRFYTKPVLIENGLASQDDFGILAHIDYKKICSKGEAIETNIIDSTTGIEIIKRLIKQGLISEKANENDKRQKLVSLTEEGKAKLHNIYVGFAKIQDVMAELNVKEREHLISTLTILDKFHTKNIESL